MFRVKRAASWLLMSFSRRTSVVVSRLGIPSLYPVFVSWKHLVIRSCYDKLVTRLGILTWYSGGILVSRLGILSGYPDGVFVSWLNIQSWWPVLVWYPILVIQLVIAYWYPDSFLVSCHSIPRHLLLLLTLSLLPSTTPEINGHRLTTICFLNRLWDA